MSEEDALEQLIQSTRTNFTLAPDQQAISRINETVEATREARQSRRDESRAVLRALSRNLQLARDASDAERRARAALDHTNVMLERDREKFALAKSLNEIEASAASLELQLEEAQSELAALEATRPSEAALQSSHLEENTNILKLKCYRSLGIELAQDEAGNFDRAIVRNGKDVHVVNIESKYSKFFYANYLWNLVAE